MPSGAGAIPALGPEAYAHLSGPVSRGVGSTRELGVRGVWIMGGVYGVVGEKGKKEAGRQGDRNRLEERKPRKVEGNYMEIRRRQNNRIL